MKKLQPVTFSAEENQALQSQLGTQTEQKAVPKSRDPINYPVFEVPVNKKVLVYVPNHIVQDEEGIDRLRMDKPLIHSVTQGKKFLYFRCINGLTIDGTEFNGDCPLCDAKDEPWDLANLIIEQKCKAQGLDPEDVDNESVKSIRSAAFSDRVLKDATRYYTFPIVVFETVNDDGKTFVGDENGGYKYHIMWYNISESQYEKVWLKALEAMESEPTHPGGNFFLLNYCYTPKRGEPNKRDSARNLAVSARNIKGSEGVRKLLDEQTASWTPELAQQMVINNAIYSPSDLQEVADDALETTRNLLALYQAKEAGAEGALPGEEPKFQLEEKQSEEVNVAGAVEDTDEDIEMQ